MENVIDIRTALEHIGTGWQFGGSVTAGTQESWDAVTWEDSRVKPTWEELCAAHAAIPPVSGPPVIITSDNITMADADALCGALGAGEKTAAWLIAKLEL